MFAYCQNNPVMYVDPSGYSWYSDAGLTWPGEIHAAVQDYLIQTKMFDAPGYEFDFFSKEVYIESVGRIDLIDRGMGAYEIKPISYLNTTGLASAYFQLLAYVEASNGKYHLGTLEFSTNFIYKGYSVNVFSVGMGVILYSYTKIKQHQHENETVRQRNVVAVKNRTAAMKAFEAILINGAVGVPADIPADVVGAVGMGTVVFYGISSFLGGGDLLGGLNRQNMYVAVR